MGTQEKICGLCLKICDNFKAIEGDMKDILEVVLPKIDLPAIWESVMCIDCVEMLIKCFDFKTVCFYTYDDIVPFADKAGIKLNLNDIYLNKNGNDTSVPENHVICSFCIGCVKNCSAVSLDVKERDIMLDKMIVQCLPELNLNLIEEPVVCAPCHGSLENCFHFMTNCLIVEEKIKKYCQTQDSRGEMELSSLLQFVVRDVTTSKGMDNSVDIIKEETQLCEESENADERKIDTGGSIFKSKPTFYADSENVTEENSNKLNEITIEEKCCIENEAPVKEESLFEMEDHKFLANEEIEIKTDEHDLNRFKDDTVLSQSESSTRLSKRRRCLMPNLEEDLSCVKHTPTNRGVTKITMHQCESCSFQTKYKRYLKSHLILHKDPSKVTMYKCAACSFETKWKEHLKRHQLIHKDPSEITMYKCDSCSFQSRQKSGLKTHLLVHKDPSEITMYKCDSCSFQSRQKGGLKAHLLVHKGLSKKTIYNCDTCSYQTRHKFRLKKHLLVHEEGAMHKCDFCSFESMYKDRLKKHLLKHKEASEITMYKCNYCLYEVKYKHRLKDHLLVHKNPSEITMYKCDSCTFQAKYKNYITKHLLTHKDPSDVTMYKCAHCSFQTKRKYHLPRHELNHKKPSEVAMYKCYSCSYQTRHKFDLKKHVLIHRNPPKVTMFNCDFCSFQTKHKRDHNRHLLVHKSPSEVTMYKCDSCSYQSKRKDKLKRHLQVHIARKPMAKKVNDLLVAHKDK